MFEFTFSISILCSRGSLQRLLCRLMLLVRVVAFVSVTLVGVVGVGIVCVGDVPKNCRFRLVIGVEGMVGRASESEGVVRCKYAAGCSPTSRTRSTSSFR